MNAQEEALRLWIRRTLPGGDGVVAERLLDDLLRNIKEDPE